MLLLVSATVLAPDAPTVGDPFAGGWPREPQWFAAPQVDASTDLRHPFAPFEQSSASSRRKAQRRPRFATGNDLRDPGWSTPSPRWSSQRLWAPDLRDPHTSQSARAVTFAMVDPELRDPFLGKRASGVSDADLRDPFVRAPASGGPPIQRPRSMRHR